MKPVVFHILMSLAEKDSHGYGVILSVREHSRGRLRLETGPFYRHLRKLMDDHLVGETDAPVDADSRRGAYYRLTQLGRRVVVAEARRLAQDVSVTQALGLLKEEA